MPTAIEKAVEKAKEANFFPDIGIDPGRITRFGCLDRWGVGVQPGWCETRRGQGKTCKECWNQEVKGKDAAS